MMMMNEILQFPTQPHCSLKVPPIVLESSPLYLLKNSEMNSWTSIFFGIYNRTGRHFTEVQGKTAKR